MNAGTAGRPTVGMRCVAAVFPAACPSESHFLDFFPKYKGTTGAIELLLEQNIKEILRPKEREKEKKI